jgi:hypothetical protein
MKCLRVIHHDGNRGYGAALITGFQNATKDLIFIPTAMDSTIFAKPSVPM